MQEQKRSFGGKYLFFGALIALGSAILPFGLMLAGAYFALVMYKARPSSLIFTGGFFALIAYIFYGGYLGVILTALAVVPAALLYALHKAKVRSTTIIALLVAANILMLYLAVCLPGILSGAGAFSAIQTVVDQILAASRETAASMAASVYGAESARFLESYDAYMKSFSSAVPDLVVPVIASLSVSFSFSNFLFFRLFAKKRVMEVPRLPKFSTWRIPDFYTGGICFFLIGSVVLELFGLDYAAAVSSTVNVLVGAPLMLQGLSTIDYIILRRAKNVTTSRVLIFIGVGLLFPLLQTALMLLGCAEQLFHYRERIDALPPRAPKI